MDTRTLSEKRRDAALKRHSLYDTKETARIARLGYARNLLREIAPDLADQFDARLAARGVAHASS